MATSKLIGHWRRGGASLFLGDTAVLVIRCVKSRGSPTDGPPGVVCRATRAHCFELLRQIPYSRGDVLSPSKKHRGRLSPRLFQSPAGTRVPRCRNLRPLIGVGHADRANGAPDHLRRIGCCPSGQAGHVRGARGHFPIRTSRNRCSPGPSREGRITSNPSGHLPAWRRGGIGRSAVTPRGAGGTGGNGGRLGA